MTRLNLKKKFNTKFNKKLFTSNEGMSLAEVLISLVIVGILALLVTRVTQQSNKSAKKLDVNSDITNTVNEIGALLTDPQKCRLTFEGTTRDPDAIVSALNEDNSTKPPTYTEEARKFSKSSETSPGSGVYDGDGFGASKVKITGYDLQEGDPLLPEGSVVTGEETLVVSFKNKTILEGAGGGDIIERELAIYVERDPSTDELITCRSLSNSIALIWQRGVGTDIFYSGGNVGINTDKPNAALDVNGDIHADNIIAQTFLYSSDARLKKNVEGINNPISKINRIRGVSFDWRSTGRKDYGFIAQEIRKEIPEIVVESKSVDHLTVDYAKVVPILLEAIKKQNDQIDALEREVEALK